MTTVSPSRLPLTLGVLGGAGPWAAIHFQAALLTAWSSLTGAWRDEDFPSLLVDTRPYPGMSEAGLVDPVAATQALEAGAHRLVRQGAQALVVPCFSLHRTTPRLPAPWWSLRNAAVARGRWVKGPVVVLEAGGNGPESLSAWWHRAHGQVYPLTAAEQDIVQHLIACGMGQRWPLAEAPIEQLRAAVTQRVGPVTWVLGCSDLHRLPVPSSQPVFDALVESAQAVAYRLAHPWTTPSHATAPALVRSFTAA